MSVLVIIVHYGSVELTSRAVQSVLSSTVQPAEVLIVDNGPGPSYSDPSEDVRVLRPGTNLGFAAGVNYASAQARPGWRFLWLLNNDAVAEPTALSELLDSAIRDEPALVSSSIWTLDSDRPWFEGATFYPWRLESRHERARSEPIPPGKPSWRQVPYLPGCSLLIPAEAWERVGELDDRYFVYGEDVDYSTRARRAGFGLRVAEASIVHHRASSATSHPERARMQAGSATRLTWGLFPWLLPYAIVFGVAAATKRGLRLRSPWLLTATLRGYADALFGPRGELRPRRANRALPPGNR